MLKQAIDAIPGLDKHVGKPPFQATTSEMEDPLNRTYTVLIVDDSDDDRFILKRYLKKTKLSLVVLEAVSGIEAFELLGTPVELLRLEHPNISFPVTLFLDINMPLMTGWEFVEELDKRMDDIQLKPTIVVMYSTSDTDHEKRRALNYPMVANYIVKGESTPERLRQTIFKCSGGVA